MLYSGEKLQTEKNDPSINNNLPVVTASGMQVAGFVVMSIFSLSTVYFYYKVIKTNKLNRLQIKINQNASNIDVQLQKRFDTLTKLVSAVKSQAKFDKSTLETISAYRSNAKNASLNEKVASIDKISNGINMAFEAYPNLGADASVNKLMTEATMIEKEIAAARRLYNADVTSFNEMIYTFPTNVVLRKKNVKGIPLFAASEESKQDVSLDFFS